ncbi:MAG: hypothetical protein B6I22_10405 [Desulfobacteraceae bacterium 4572_123]|nr:MAG: hypothetical protein B6I22_10405 [Desulfobacteraceae bacterium 4572_123]
MGFIRKQEEKIALRLLIWQYGKKGTALPALSVLQNQAAQVVNQAHEIAGKRGRNVISIIKELAGDISSDLKNRNKKK